MSQFLLDFANPGNGLLPREHQRAMAKPVQGTIANLQLAAAEYAQYQNDPDIERTHVATDMLFKAMVTVAEITGYSEAQAETVFSDPAVLHQVAHGWVSLVG